MSHIQVLKMCPIIMVVLERYVHCYNSGTNIMGYIPTAIRLFCKTWNLYTVKFFAKKFQPDTSYIKADGLLLLCCYIDIVLNRHIPNDLFLYPCIKKSFKFHKRR